MLTPARTSPISPSRYRVTQDVFAIERSLKRQLSLHLGSVHAVVMRSGHVPAYCVAVCIYVFWKVRGGMVLIGRGQLSAMQYLRTNQTATRKRL
jgi:hypothetical protein